MNTSIPIISRLTSQLRVSDPLPTETEHTKPRQLSSSSAGSEEEPTVRRKDDRVADVLEKLPTSGVTLFTSQSAPNGHKVAFVLAELGVDCHIVNLNLRKGQHKSPAYLGLNPNGRIPTIIDHDNQDFVLWESGAIVQYLCQSRAATAIELGLWSSNVQTQAELSSWLYFQATGHAPMIGQALHLRYFGAEGQETAKVIAEVRRLYEVLEVRLAEQRESLDLNDEPDTPVWLVGTDMTVADLVYLPWNLTVSRIDVDFEDELPEVWRWTQSMLDRPAVRQTFDESSSTPLSRLEQYRGETPK